MLKVTSIEDKLEESFEEGPYLLIPIEIKNRMRLNNDTGINEQNLVR